MKSMWQGDTIFESFDCKTFHKLLLGLPRPLCNLSRKMRLNLNNACRTELVQKCIVRHEHALWRVPSSRASWRLSYMPCKVLWKYVYYNPIKLWCICIILVIMLSILWYYDPTTSYLKRYLITRRVGLMLLFFGKTFPCLQRFRVLSNNRERKPVSYRCEVLVRILLFRSKTPFLKLPSSWSFRHFETQWLLWGTVWDLSYESACFA